MKQEANNREIVTEIFMEPNTGKFVCGAIYNDVAAVLVELADDEVTPVYEFKNPSYTSPMKKVYPTNWSTDEIVNDITKMFIADVCVNPGGTGSIRAHVLLFENARLACK